MMAHLPSVLGTTSPLRWADEDYVAGLFGDRVESLEVGRRETELGFADEDELRDFLKKHHPVTVRLYREAGDSPEALAELDDVLRAMINLWYGRREGEQGSFVQAATFIVARKRQI
jgi:hypothetical protein